MTCPVLSESPWEAHLLITLALQLICSQALAVVLSVGKAGKKKEINFLNIYYGPGTGLFN